MYWIKALLGVTLLVGMVPAYGQPAGFGRARTPTVSPYLNLLNDSNSTAFNYYQLYRPQTEFRSAYQNLNRNLDQAERRIARHGEALEDISEIVRPGASLRVTGHPTSFMSYGSYFPSR